MPAASDHIKLGNGIYTVPDLAQILNLPKQKVRRWLGEYYDVHLGRDNSSKYSWGAGREKATDFLTLVEFHVFYILREQKIGVGKILDAHKQMEKELKTKHPFASYRLLVNQKQILYALDEETWVRADKTNQIVMMKLIEDFFKKIDFSDDQLASRFWPLGKDRKVVVDPHHQFGQPVISGTNINAATIFSMYQSGEPIPAIGILYDLTEEQVNDAIAFCKRKVAA